MFKENHCGTSVARPEKLLSRKLVTGGFQDLDQIYRHEDTEGGFGL